MPSLIVLKLGGDIRVSSRSSTLCLFYLSYCLFTIYKHGAARRKKLEKRQKIFDHYFSINHQSCNINAVCRHLDPNNIWRTCGYVA
jgi:hypothetical protein